MNLNIQNTFSEKLPADPNPANTRRQVFESAFSFVNPTSTVNPSIVHVSKAVASFLGLTEEDIASQEFLDVFSGTKVFRDTKPYAMCYGGHQFGHWAGQLGDGRAINLMEIVHENKRWALQLKGAGPTPYSRTADGLAVLRSSIREHLCSEAMYHLGVPTTRSLSLIKSGEKVARDMMYNGNVAYEDGAIVCRVAPSFIRFGNFQIFASRKDHKTLRQLVDYTIDEFFPEITIDTPDRIPAFFKSVAERTLKMIVDWQRVGFVHGVMNTDNLSILGLTIDYGPYGWLEGYDPDWTPNTTDKQNKRYRYGYQPRIALWNLLQLANAIYPLVENAKPFEEVLENFQKQYRIQYLQMMGQKIGIENVSEQDAVLIDALQTVLQATETDMTIFFRNLAEFNPQTEITEDGKFLEVVEKAFYKPEEIEREILMNWKDWFTKYNDRLTKDTRSDEERKSSMNLVNPKYVLRNYMAQIAIEAAEKNDYSILNELHELLKKPYDEQVDSEKWFEKRPEWARHKVGCSMLSCSS